MLVFEGTGNSGAMARSDHTHTMVDVTDLDPIPYLVFSESDSDTTVSVHESGPYELRFAGPLGVWIALLKTAGSSTTTIKVRKGGVDQGTITLASSATRATVDLSGVTGAVGDLLTVATTAAGTGAKGLTVLGPVA